MKILSIIAITLCMSINGYAKLKVSDKNSTSELSVTEAKNAEATGISNSQ
jgi:hypothetical protein